MTTQTAEQKMPSSTRRGFLILTLGTVGGAGIFLAANILLGGTDSGIFTALIILLADAFLVAGFFARHNWLRNTSWTLTSSMLITSLFGLWWKPLAVFLDNSEEYSRCVRADATHSYPCGTEIIYWSQVWGALALALGVLAFFSVVVSLLSLTWERIREVRWVVGIYRTVSVLFAVSGLLYAYAIMEETFSGMSVGSSFIFGSAALSLAGTGVATVIVASLVFRSKRDEEPAQAVLNKTTSSSGSVDFQSVEAREAFQVFMAEYEAKKESRRNNPES